MKDSNRRLEIIMSLMGILLAWGLLIVGFFAIRGIGGVTVQAITNGLLIGNVIVSTIIYMKVLRKK